MEIADSEVVIHPGNPVALRLASLALGCSLSCTNVDYNLRRNIASHLPRIFNWNYTYGGGRYSGKAVPDVYLKQEAYE